MRKKVIDFALGAMLLALCLPAQGEKRQLKNTGSEPAVMRMHHLLGPKDK